MSEKEKKKVTSERKILDSLKKKSKEQEFVLISSKFLSILSGILVSVIGTFSTSLQIFKGENWESLKNESLFYWIVGLILLLLIILTFTPRIIKSLTNQTTPKETLLRESIVSTYTKALDKTFLNPDN